MQIQNQKDMKNAKEGHLYENTTDNKRNIENCKR